MSRTLLGVASSPFAREFIVFAASTVVLQGSRAAVGLFAARELGPATWGMWYALNLVLAYGGLVHLGILNAMNREVPLLLGQGYADRAHRTRDVTLGALLPTTLFGVVALLIASLVMQPPARASLAMLAILFATFQLLSFFQFDLKTRMLFTALSRQQLAYAFAFPLVAVPLVYAWGLSGFIAAQAFVTAAICFPFARDYAREHRPAFSWPEAIHLIKVGLPIMAVGLLYTLLTTIDRWFIGALIDLEALGHYSLAIMVFGILSLIPLTIAQQIYPRMAHAYGQTGRHEIVRSWAVRQALLAAGITVPIAIAIFAAAPAVVARWLPDYVAGIPAMQWILFGPVVLAASGGFGNLLNTLNRQNTVLWIQAISLSLNVVLNLWLIAIGWGITGVAIGTAASFAAYGIMMILVGLRVSRPRDRTP